MDFINFFFKKRNEYKFWKNVITVLNISQMTISFKDNFLKNYFLINFYDFETFCYNRREKKEYFLN